MKQGPAVAERSGHSRKASSSITAKSSREYERKWPRGVEVTPGRGVHFRVWAPKSKKVRVELSSSLDLKDARIFDLSAEEKGYFSGLVEAAAAGMHYRFRLDQGSFADAASRFQPEGPHGPSQIIDPSKFKWTDR